MLLLTVIPLTILITILYIIFSQDRIQSYLTFGLTAVLVQYIVLRQVSLPTAKGPICVRGSLLSVAGT